MADYMAAWKMFRNHCNEDFETARHLQGRSSWPARRSLRVCDLGCGDGRLISALLAAIPGRISEVRLVDPDHELLEEAVRCIRRSNPEVAVKCYVEYARDITAVAAADADVVLAVHVAYLMEDDELAEVLEEMPASAILYVVLDAADSVFATLWARTAPLHHRRAQVARALLDQRVGAISANAKSEIIAKVPKALISRETSDFSGLLLSLMCYRDMTTAVPQPLHRYVSRVLDEFTSGDSILCKSICYEIASVSS